MITRLGRWVLSRLRRFLPEWLLTAPSLLWLLLFFVIPSLLVFTVAFRPPDPYGRIGEGWTLDTLARLMQPSYPAILWRTLRVSMVTTLVCLVMAVPAGYWLARQPASRRHWTLLLVILPFWTNFLIRIFAWRTVLHPEGFLQTSLVKLGILSSNASLLYNEGAVLVVLIYTYLPFAIMPVYAAAERFDFQLLDAAQDLGATRFQAFVRVFLPSIQIGLLTATLMVFIPALGSYAIPDLVGGPSSEMVGNKIAQRVFTDRNLPHASGLSALLALAVILPMVIAMVVRSRHPDKVPVEREKGGPREGGAQG